MSRTLVSCYLSWISFPTYSESPSVSCSKRSLKTHGSQAQKPGSRPTNLISFESFVAVFMSSWYNKYHVFSFHSDFSIPFLCATLQGQLPTNSACSYSFLQNESWFLDLVKTTRTSFHHIWGHMNSTQFALRTSKIYENDINFALEQTHQLALWPTDWQSHMDSVQMMNWNFWWRGGDAMCSKCCCIMLYPLMSNLASSGWSSKQQSQKIHAPFRWQINSIVVGNINISENARIKMFQKYTSIWKSSPSSEEGWK